MSQRYPRLLYMCKGLMKLLAKTVSRKYVSRCQKCNYYTDDIVEHWLCYCASNADSHKIVWNYIIDNIGLPEFREYSLLSPNKQCEFLLSLSLEVEFFRFKHHKLVQLLIQMC